MYGVRLIRTVFTIDMMKGLEIGQKKKKKGFWDPNDIVFCFSYMSVFTLG